MSYGSFNKDTWPGLQSKSVTSEDIMFFIFIYFPCYMKLV